MKYQFGLIAAAVAFSTSAFAQTKWDLPAAYPATNFHTVNLTEFANDVDKATGGKLKITVHPNAALFKAPEIKRAVQGGQAQIGEVLLVNFQNEWQLFGADGIPFLADSYDEAVKLWKAQKPFMDKKLAADGMMALYAVPWPPARHLRQEAHHQRGRPQRREMARLQPRHGTHRRAGGRTAGDRAGRRAVAGHGHRCHRKLYVFGLHRL
jgi:TRAP-type C4-dicarboxylate transport system substrate-binding protein